MKFTDGYWLLQKGLTAHYPQHLYDHEIQPESVTLYAPVREIARREDTLNSTLITVRLSSPLEDVLRVRITHFAGARPCPPHFDLAVTAEAPVAAKADDSWVTITSGRLSARVPRTGPWRIEFLSGERPLTVSPSRGIGYIEKSGGERYIHDQLSLGVGECIYGLGERFTAFVKNGQEVEIWNRDGGTSSEQAYKNVPFYISSGGYGVFVNHPERVSFEVGSEKVSRVQFSVPGETLEYFIINGPSPKEVLARYTALTGRPALPPAWSFGLWLSTSFTTSYDEKSVSEIVKGMEDRDLPLSVFHFDPFWMRELNWCDFQWDSRTFPDAAAMLARLKKKGLRVCLWINPYIAQRSPLFEEAARQGYLLRKPDGDIWQIDLWQPGMGVVDFTSAEARRWYSARLAELLDMGVDSFKTDFGERIPTEAVYSDGSDPEKMHNYYSFLYNRTVFELLEERRGAGEAVVFARSATAGCQRFPVHWGGDCDSSFESMAESLRGGLSLGLCGFGFWSHDIGGFEGIPPADLYKRWIAFGLLSSHSRLHGSTSYRVPWLFDEDSVSVLRRFTNLKCRLMPYLYAAAVEAAETGVPVMRAMLLEYPEDPACVQLERQYMLGGSLLVAPVFRADGTVEYYLPEGRWTSLLSGEAQSGPGWRRERHGYLSLPLMMRPNSVVPMGEREDRPDYAYTEGLLLYANELADGAVITTTVPDLSGRPAAVFETRRKGDAVSVSLEGSAARWGLLLLGVTKATSLKGGRAETDPIGLLVRADAGAKRVSLKLK